MFFDPVYFIYALPGLILGIYAQMKVKSTFARYQKVVASTGLTGAQAAARMLQYAGVNNCSIQRGSGFLSDYYDPSAKVLKLSPAVYDGNNLSAIGVACHEAGHAVQHAQAYTWLWLRSLMVPAVQLGNWLYCIIFFLGFLLQSPDMIKIGIALFALGVIFTIVTLPVEWNASARAKKLMVDAGVVSSYEATGAGAVLNAAFLTYVAATIQAILTLLYYLSLISGNRDRK